MPWLAAIALVGTTTVGCASGRHFPSSAPSTAAVTTASLVPQFTATTQAPTSVSLSTPAPAAAVTSTAAPAHPAVTVARSASTTTAAPTRGPVIAGCPLFPADNPWRRDVSRDPIDPHSGAWVASAGLSTHLHPDFGADPTYGIPYVVVPASQAKVPITFTAYGSESDPGPYPVPRNAPVESGSDAHVLVAS
ncbi:MAG: hypothetical protein QOE15_2900, partial [Acidimicrobiaceae bacterium]|nr:hypothetical protein [Acidimicrobiaceae bacterium]